MWIIIIKHNPWNKGCSHQHTLIIWNSVNSYLEHIFVFSHFWMSCDQAPQHPKLPPGIWGLLQHFHPDLQGFLCLIWLIQPQALLYLLFGLVLAHFWCSEPHKNINSFRPCKFSEAARKQILAMHSTSPQAIPWRWSSKRWEPDGLPGPVLSAPAVLRQRGNRIHRRKTTIQHNCYRQLWCVETKKTSPFNCVLILSHHWVFKSSPSAFCLKNAKETRFPVEG